MQNPLGKFTKNKYKLVYNNYQFYENDALVEFIDAQAKEGYYLCGMIGRLASVLKFRYHDTCIQKSYAIYCKHLDEKIDTAIEKMKAEGKITACENIQFIIFETALTDGSDKDLTMGYEKQRNLLGVSLKKSLPLMAILFFAATSMLSLKIFLEPDGISKLFLLKCAMCISLNVIFIIYLVGDLHDLKAGKAIHTRSVMYFSERTRFKNAMFRLGDIGRLILFLGSLFSSILLLAISKDLIILLEIMGIWLVYGMGGYLFKLKYRRAYIWLLFASLFLAIFVL